MAGRKNSDFLMVRLAIKLNVLDVHEFRRNGNGSTYEMIKNTLYKSYLI